MIYQVLLLEPMPNLDDAQIWYGLGVALEDINAKLPLKAHFKKKVIVSFPIATKLKIGDVIEAEEKGNQAVKILIGKEKVLESFPTIQINERTRVYIDSGVVFSLNFFNALSNEAFLGWSSEVGLVMAPSVDLRHLNKLSVFQVYQCRLICGLHFEDRCVESRMYKKHGTIWYVSSIQKLSPNEEAEKAKLIAEAKYQPPEDGRLHFYLASEPLWWIPSVPYKLGEPKVENCEYLKTQPSVLQTMRSLYETPWAERLIAASMIYDLKKVTDFGILVNTSNGVQVYTSSGLKKLQFLDFMNFGKFLEIRGIEGPAHIKKKIVERPDIRSTEWIDARPVSAEFCSIDSKMLILTLLKTPPHTIPDVFVTTILKVDMNSRKIQTKYPLLRSDDIEVSESVVPFDLHFSDNDWAIVDLLFVVTELKWKALAIRKYQGENELEIQCLNRIATQGYERVTSSAWKPIGDERDIREFSGWVIALRKKFVFIWPCVSATDWKGCIIVERSSAPAAAGLGDYVKLTAQEVEFNRTEMDPIGIGYKGIEILNWTLGYQLKAKRVVHEKVSEVTVWFEFALVRNSPIYWNPTKLEAHSHVSTSYILDAQYGIKTFCSDELLNRIKNYVKKLEGNTKVIATIELPCLLNPKPANRKMGLLSIDDRLDIEKEVARKATFQNNSFG